jgi:hypothetical protein
MELFSSYGATTSSSMGKWRPPDSARRIGLETTFMNLLTVVESGVTAGEEVLAEFLPSDFGDVLGTLATTTYSMVTWSHGWIQCVRKQSW